MKKTILHFIYSLGRGGAETMLVRVIKELKEYNNIVVTLKADNDFEGELECDKLISMDLKSIATFPLGIKKLKTIIKENNVDMVHSHLFWPTVISRIAVPKNIPLVTTIHTFVCTSLDYKKWYIRSIGKFTYKLRKSVIITVAKGAQEEYFSFLKLKPYKTFVLYTFVDLERYSKQNNTLPNSHFKLISTGSLKKQKNQRFLIQVMALLKDSDIELHIYGEGPLRQELQQLIDKTGAKVTLKGTVKNVEDILPQYDAFVMSSAFEGFSLAVLEAMAVKIPMLLSDISSFREQCSDTSLYYKFDDTVSFLNQLELLRNNNAERDRLRNDAYERVRANFTLPHHMLQLRKIYTEVLDGQ
ncbi:MAG: glycosyltransferase [Ferruginibacter sp.]